MDAAGTLEDLSGRSRIEMQRRVHAPAASTESESDGQAPARPYQSSLPLHCCQILYHHSWPFHLTGPTLSGQQLYNADCGETTSASRQTRACAVTGDGLVLAVKWSGQSSQIRCTSIDEHYDMLFL